MSYDKVGLKWNSIGMVPQSPQQRMQRASSSVLVFVSSDWTWNLRFEKKQID